MIPLDRLEALLASFPRLTIGLVGDLFLDRYLDIDRTVDEKSIETNLLAYQVAQIRNGPGALGTVMNNLAALRVGRLVPVTVIGDDGHAYDLISALKQLPVDLDHVIQDPARMTPTYTKPMRRDDSGEWQELNRLDFRSRAPLGDAMLSTLLEHLTGVFHSCDGLIVLDQIEEDGWGVVDARVREHLASLADQSPNKLMFVDSRAHIDRFSRGILKPNLAECLAAVGRSPDDNRQAGEAAAAELAERTGLVLFVTLGEAGILIVEPGKSPVVVPGCAVSGPVDIVGAGDSATAGIVSSLLSGASYAEAAAIGNLVASVTVQQIGTTGTAAPEQVVARWREVN